MRKPLRCVVGLHHEEWSSTEDGERFRRCSRCHREQIFDDVGGPTSGIGASGQGIVPF